MSDDEYDSGALIPRFQQESRCSEENTTSRNGRSSKLNRRASPTPGGDVSAKMVAETNQVANTLTDLLMGGHNSAINRLGSPGGTLSEYANQENNTTTIV